MKYVLTTAGMALMAALSLAAEGAPGSSPCPDPAADIELALVSKTGPTSGRVRVTGVVRNFGSTAWTASNSSHRLHMELAQKNSPARPDGDVVEPPIAISQLSPGQQFRIDHQVNWEVSKSASYPGFIVRFYDSGTIGAAPASYRPDCRADNNRKEITAADINRLFASAPSSNPLKVENYRLLGGVGVNTVEATLAYNRTSVAAGKITASVAAPYSGTADEVSIAGKTGTAKVRVHIPCEPKSVSNLPARSVVIVYRLWSSLGLPGGSSWVVSFSAEQPIRYGELCHVDPMVRPSRASSP